METLNFSPKDIIFREGEPGHCAYIVKEGAVEILKHAEHGEVQLAVLEKGALFGEMAILYPRDARSASARALSDVTLEILSADALEQLMAQCPPQIVPIVHTLFARLRDVNQRLATKERATTTLEHTIDQITVQPATGSSCAFEPVTIKVANLPFSIGGYAKADEYPHTNDLDLPCDGPPLMISQKHLRFEKQSDGVYAVDQGSRFCSIVNSIAIGRGKADTKAALQPGENNITLGDFTSNYKLMVLAE